MSEPFSQKLPPGETKALRIVNSLNRVIEGRGDNYGSVTLRASNTTTDVAADFVSENSTILLSPRTAHAAAELAAGGCYVSAKRNGGFTLTHANNGQTDRTFDYSWSG